MDSSDEQYSALKVEFRPKKKTKYLRKKRNSSGSEDEKQEQNMSELLEDAKELRKLRNRPNGVSDVRLALGKKLSNEEELASDDPFKLKTGGFIDMKALNRKGRTGAEELDAVNLGSVFSAETNQRDEDADITGAEELDNVNVGSVSSAETFWTDEKVDIMKSIEEELLRKGASHPISKLIALCALDIMESLEKMPPLYEFLEIK